MKQQENMLALAQLEPDYMGFIFYEKSPRHFNATLPKLPKTIKKTGVFVNATFDFILEKVNTYHFQAIQLHGDESAEYCQQLRAILAHVSHGHASTIINAQGTPPPIELFKVFGIKDTFDFETLVPYEGLVDYFLFDTKGKEKGGNGYTFDWRVLKAYQSTTPLLLSGGIGPEEIAQIKAILKTNLPIHALDLNSKFEDAPGLKNIKQLRNFITEIRTKTE